MNGPNSISERQAGLESRALALSGVDLAATGDLRSVLGRASDWTIEVGPVRLLLIPFLREWWFFDEAHREWRSTGRKVGEASFELGPNGLVIRDGAVKTTANLEPGTSDSSSQSTREEEAPAQQRLRRFCSACGSPIKATWKFCQTCGAKLIEGPQ